MPETQDFPPDEFAAPDDLEGRIVGSLPADRFEVLRKDEVRFLDFQRAELRSIGRNLILRQVVLGAGLFPLGICTNLFDFPYRFDVAILTAAFIAEAGILAAAAVRADVAEAALNHRRFRLAALLTDSGLEEEPTAVHPHLAPCARAS